MMTGLLVVAGTLHSHRATASLRDEPSPVSNSLARRRMRTELCRNGPSRLLTSALVGQVKVDRLTSELVNAQQTGAKLLERNDVHR
jgi:hypothetical protein